MKSEKLMRALNDVSDELVAEAAQRRRHPLVRIAALAACFAVLAVGMLPFLQGLGGTGHDDVDDALPIITHNGALYEIWRDGKHAVSERLSLPTRITKAMVGKECGKSSHPDATGTIHYYQPIYGKTGTGPAALCVLERTDEGHEGEYWWLIFTGIASTGDENDYAEAESLFPIYGIHSAADIASIETPDGEEIDPERFYDALMTHDCTNWKGWYEELFGSAETEEEYLALEEKYFEGSAQLRLESELGLVAYLTYYPTVDYVVWSESYIHIDAKLLP